MRNKALYRAAWGHAEHQANNAGLGEAGKHPHKDGVPALFLFSHGVCFLNKNTFKTAIYLLGPQTQMLLSTGNALQT